MAIEILELLAKLDLQGADKSKRGLQEVQREAKKTGQAIKDIDKQADFSSTKRQLEGLIGTIDKAQREADDGVEVDVSTDGVQRTQNDLRGVLDLITTVDGQDAEVTVTADISDAENDANTVRRIMSELDALTAESTISADTSDFDRDTDSVRRVMTELGSLSAETKITSDTSDIDTDAATVRALMASLDAQTAEASITGDTSDLDADVASAQALLAAFEGQSATANINADTTDYMSDHATVQSMMSEIDGRQLNTYVNLDTAGAQANLAAWQTAAQAAAAQDIDVDVDLDTGGAIAQLTAFNAVAAGTTGALGSVNSVASMSSVTFAAMAAAVVLGAGSLTALLGAGAAAAAMFTGAAAGAGLLGGAIYVMVQGLYDGGAAFDAMSAKASELHDAFVQAVGPASEIIAEIGIAAMDVASNYIPLIGPAATATAEAARASLGAFFEWLSGEAAQGYIQNIFAGAPEIVADLLTAVTTFGEGFIAIMSAAMPYAIQLADYIGNIGEAFATWAQSAAGQEQITAAIQTAIPIFQALWDMVLQVGAALLAFAQQNGPAVAEAIGMITTVITTAISVFSSLVSVIGPIGITIAALAPIVLAAVAAFSAIIGVIGTLVTAVTGVGTAFIAVGAAFGLAASTVLIIVAAIGLLVAAAVLIYENWGPISQFFIDLWTSVTEAFNTAITTITTALSTLGTTIMSYLTPIVETVTAWGTAIVTALTTAFTTVVTAVTTAFQGVYDAIVSVLTTISDYIAYWGPFFGEAFVIVLAALVGLVAVALEPLITTFQAVWDAIYAAAQAAWELITSVVTTAWEGVVSVVQPILESLQSAVQTAWDAISTAIQTAMDTISSVVQTGWDAVSTVVSDSMNYIWNDIIVPIWDSISSAIETSMTYISDTILTPMWEAISTLIYDTMNYIWNEVIVPLWESISTAIFDAMTYIHDTVLVPMWEAISTLIYDTMNYIWNEVIVPIWESISTAIYDSLTYIYNDVIVYYWDLISTYISEVLTAIQTAISDTWTAIVEGIAGFGQSLYDAVYEAFANAVRSGGEIIASLLQGVGDALASWDLTSEIGNTISGMADTVLSITGQWKDGGIASAIGAYAKGGVANFQAGGMGTTGRNARVHVWNEGAGNEAYIAERGPRANQIRYLNQAASWFGYQVLPQQGGERGDRNWHSYSYGSAASSPRSGLSAFCAGGCTGGGGGYRSGGCSCAEKGGLMHQFAHGGMASIPVATYYCGGREWSDAVWQMVSQIEGQYSTYANTYQGHPGGMENSADFWGGSGCPAEVGSEGDRIYSAIHANWGSELAWIIWNGQIDHAGGSEPYDDPSDMHYDHVHATLGGGGVGGGGFICTSIKAALQAAIDALLAPARTALTALGFPIGDFGNAVLDGPVQDMIDALIALVPTCGSSAGDMGGPLDPQVEEWKLGAIEELGEDPGTWQGPLNSLIRCESGGDPNADNSYGSGAAGILQLMPDTWEGYRPTRCTDIYDPVCNIMASMNYQKAMYGTPQSTCPYELGGIASFLTGGRVPGAGAQLAMLHGGERVLSRRTNAQFEDVMGMFQSGGLYPPLAGSYGPGSGITGGMTSPTFGQMGPNAGGSSATMAITSAITQALAPTGGPPLGGTMGGPYATRSYGMTTPTFGMMGPAAGRGMESLANSINTWSRGSLGALGGSGAGATPAGVDLRGQPSWGGSVNIHQDFSNLRVGQDITPEQLRSLAYEGGYSGATALFDDMRIRNRGQVVRGRRR